MNEPRWIGRKDCVTIHELMLARYGGAEGIRDERLLEAALGKPRERFAAGGAHLAELAGCYASGILAAQPFVSGNSCTAFLVAATFLQINGLVFTGRDVPAAEETLALARGDSSESFYARYLRCNSRAP